MSQSNRENTSMSEQKPEVEVSVTSPSPVSFTGETMNDLDDFHDGVKRSKSLRLSSGPNRKLILLGRQRSYINVLMKRATSPHSSTRDLQDSSSTATTTTQGPKLSPYSTRKRFSCTSHLGSGTGSPKPVHPKHRLFMRSRSAYIGPVR